MTFGAYTPDYACLIDGLFDRTDLKSLNDSQIKEAAELGFNNETLFNVCRANGTTCDGYYFFGEKRTVVSEVRSEMSGIVSLQNVRILVQ